MAQLDKFDDWCQERGLTISWNTLAIVFYRLIAEAPEYSQSADLESRDFYELMQAYRTEPLDAHKQFEAVKEWLRNPVCQYQDT